jgi:hypothetical protein
VVKARNKARLAPFNRHKEALLAILSYVYDRGPKSAPFDEIESYRRLTRLAQWYFSRDEMKKATMPAAKRAKRLGELEKALGWARIMTEWAMQDEVGEDLFIALCVEANITSASVHPRADGSSVLTDLSRKVKEVVASLNTLESAARRAARGVRRRGGRPKGTVALPLDYIIALALLYRQSTEVRPGAGPGPFARFVCEFLRGVGQAYPVSASVIDAIKDARLQAQKLLAAAGYPIASPFA